MTLEVTLKWQLLKSNYISEKTMWKIGKKFAKGKITKQLNKPVRDAAGVVTKEYIFLSVQAGQTSSQGLIVLYETVYYWYQWMKRVFLANTKRHKFFEPRETWKRHICNKDEKHCPAEMMMHFEGEFWAPDGWYRNHQLRAITAQSQFSTRALTLRSLCELPYNPEALW